MIFYRKCIRNHENEFEEGAVAPTKCRICGMKLGEQDYIRNRKSNVETYTIPDTDFPEISEQKETLSGYAFKIPKLNRLIRIPDDGDSVILGRAGLGSKEELWGFNISRQHLLLKPMQGGVLITDLGSTNGTIYKGERLEKGAQILIMPGETIILDANINDIEMILVKN